MTAPQNTATARIRDFCSDDVLWIVPQSIQCGDTAFDLDYGRRAAQGQAWTAEAADGRILACAGILPLYASHGLAWALFASDIGTAFTGITRAARRAIAVSPLKRIEALVRADHARGLDWAQAVGLRPNATLRAWGPQGIDHVLYERIAA